MFGKVSYVLRTPYLVRLSWAPLKLEIVEFAKEEGPPLAVGMINDTTWGTYIRIQESVSQSQLPTTMVTTYMEKISFNKMSSNHKYLEVYKRAVATCTTNHHAGV